MLLYFPKYQDWLMWDKRHLLLYLYSYDIIQYIHYNTTYCYRLITFFDILDRKLLILISHYIMHESLLNIIYKYILLILNTIV